MIDLSKNQNPYYPTNKIYKKIKKEVKNIKFYAEDYVKISQSTHILVNILSL